MAKYLNRSMLMLVFLLLSSFVFIAQYAHFFRFTPEVLGKYLPVRWVLMAHILAGAGALLTGPFQFLKKFRNRYMKWHRWLGRLYILCILVSASGALILTFVTTDKVGVLYTVSLWFLILVWVVSTALAYHAIRKRKVQEHEEWMVRSYLGTFAFIVQNYILKIPAVMALAPFPELSPNIFWFSWSIPVFGYQVYLCLKKLKVAPVRK